MAGRREKSLFRDICSRQYGDKIKSLANTAKDDLGLIQRLGFQKSIQVHKGCVNTICWNESGSLLLSGSDDQQLVLTNGYSFKVQTAYATSHKGNIFSAKFLPHTNDREIVSCSGDGIVLYTDLNRPQETYNNQFTCHGGTTTYEVLTVPDNPSCFLSCGEDATVRWFDLRLKNSCFEQRCKEHILVSCPRAVTALAINPVSDNHLAVGCADSTVRIYDRRYLSVTPGEHLLTQPFCTFVAPKFGEERHYRITSLNYDSGGKDMLVSYSSDYLYLFNVQEYSSSLSKRGGKKLSAWDKLRAARNRKGRISPPPVRRLRLRGDWSDTGPDARPERDSSSTSSGISQARPQLQPTLMQRMTDVLSRMLNDPITRAALSGGGEEAREGGAAGLQEDDDVPGSMETDDGQEGDATSHEPNVNDQVQASSSEPATPQLGGGSSGDRNSRSAVVRNLHNNLATLRDLRQGFIDRHGAEPSVSFRYSEQSTSTSTISLRALGESDNRLNEDAPDEPPDGAENKTRPETSVDEDVEVDYPEDESTTCDSEAAVDKSDDYSVRYEAEVKKKYTGHRNARTMIKEATFWGSQYVMSGSDCGHVFVWDRHTAEVKMLLQADRHVVNCLRPHPTLPLLATSGIDHDVKIWTPVLEDCGFDKELADDLINRNAIMLEETRDTITVPAAFMIRMLACLNQIRRGARNRTRRNTSESGS